MIVRMSCGWTYLCRNNREEYSELDNPPERSVHPTLNVVSWLWPRHMSPRWSMLQQYLSLTSNFKEHGAVDNTQGCSESTETARPNGFNTTFSRNRYCRTWARVEKALKPSQSWTSTHTQARSSVVHGYPCMSAKWSRSAVVEQAKPQSACGQ